MLRKEPYTAVNRGVNSGDLIRFGNYLFFWVASDFWDTVQDKP